MKWIIKKILLLVSIIFISFGFVNAEEESFKLEWYELINYNQLYLIFNNNLYDWDGIEYTFSLINKNDSFDDLYVEYYEIDEKKWDKILLTFDKNMQIWWEYELMVIDILDENWNNIESWIDSIITFIVPKEIIYVDIAEEEEARLVIEDENMNLNSAIEHELNSWEEVSVNFVEKNIVSESKDAIELPTTWPEHLFILLFSFILVSLGFVYKIKKS